MSTTVENIVEGEDENTDVSKYKYRPSMTKIRATQKRIAEERAKARTRVTGRRLGKTVQKPKTDRELVEEQKLFDEMLAEKKLQYKMPQQEINILKAQKLAEAQSRCKCR